MVEEQHKRLASGLRRMYQRLKNNQLWNGPVLVETDGRPSILDILAELDRIEPSTDDQTESAVSQDECTPKQEQTWKVSSEELLRQEDMDVFEIDQPLQPQELPREVDAFSLVDWDVARVCTPLPIEPVYQGMKFLEQDLGFHRPIRNTGLRDYSARMVEAQAQQGGFAVRAANTVERLHGADG